jgi:putative transposase
MKQPPRKTRRAWDEVGHAHFLTYSCLRRMPLLNRDRSRRWVVDALAGTRRDLDVALWAYVIMPEHVHVLLYPRQAGYEMRRILVALKRPVSDAARAYLEGIEDERWLERLSVEYPSRRAFRFWQPGGGFDHNVFREKTVPAVIDYIHTNPVRRGLVAQPTDWAWSSARFWEGWADVPLRMDEPFD